MEVPHDHLEEHPNGIRLQSILVAVQMIHGWVQIISM